jgi:Abnormal spindle-like microcephaly-assoc'd, ASPM-SPD-2-Hydin
MKKLFLLFIVCMVSMLAFAQTDSPTNDSSGQLAPTCVTLIPASYHFGDVAVDFSSTAPFYVLNGCSVNVIVTDVDTTGAAYTQTNNCIGILLPPADYCRILVTFAPAAQRSYDKQLIVTDHKQGDPNDPMTQTSDLAGTGVADVTLTPPSCSFGDVQIGYTGECVVTVKNNEPISLTINSIEITPPGSPFSQSNNCPGSLGKNHTCTITVIFRPEYPFPATAHLVVNTDSRDGTPPPVGLSGVGICPSDGDLFRCPPPPSN